MAIRDLLWACPQCGAAGGIRAGRGGEVCRQCGALYRRGAGSTIEHRPPEPGSAPTTRSAADWLEQLPKLEPGAFAASAADSPAGFLRREAAILREAEGDVAIRGWGRYLNRIERLGPPVRGTIALAADRLVFSGPGDSERIWPFDHITALQPSSSTLQVNARSAPLASLRFPEGSARLWEELTAAALREFFRQHGWGEIIEFQPRITTRR